jgi:hypothetical protein
MAVEVRYTCTARSKSRDAGITLSAVFTAGSMARASCGSSGREDANTVVRHHAVKNPIST